MKDISNNELKNVGINERELSGLSKIRKAELTKSE